MEICRFAAADGAILTADFIGREYTIARSLARQMGGDILLQSEPGVRTVFTVKLRRWRD